MHLEPQPGPAWIDPQHRSRILDQAVTQLLMTGRGLLVSRTDFEAVVAYHQRINHILHLLLTVFTCGAWGVIWLLVIVLHRGEVRQVVGVDEYGHVYWR
jgi:hypothetical protein